MIFVKFDYSHNQNVYVNPETVVCIEPSSYGTVIKMTNATVTVQEPTHEVADKILEALNEHKGNDE